MTGKKAGRRPVQGAKQHPAQRPAASQLRVLHLFTALGSDDLSRAARTAIASGPKGVIHAVVSADPSQRLSAADFPRGANVTSPFGFPPLAGRFGVRRLQMLARGMQGFDLIVTYGDGALDAAMAHALFGPALGLAPLVNHAGALAGRKGMLGTWYRRVALSRASAVVVANRAQQQRALGPWRQPSGKVHLVPVGVDTAACAVRPRNDLLPRLVKRPGELWIGTQARSAAGCDALLRTSASLPDEWHLVVMGEAGARDAYNAAAVALGLGHRVHSPGVIPDGAEVAGLFDLFLAGDDADGSAHAIRCAMAAGHTVIGSALPLLNELLSPENAEVLVAPGDEQALAAMMISLTGDAAHRSRIGKANRAHARRHHEIAQTVERWNEVYATALGRDSLS